MTFARVDVDFLYHASGASFGADELHALASLARAVNEQRERMPHAPIRIGHVGIAPNGDQYAVQLLVLRPCLCGAPVAQTSFLAHSLVKAVRDARAFLEAITPPEKD